MQGLPESDRRWAATLNMLGTAKHYLGDFELATTFFQNALRIWEKLSNEEQRVDAVLFNLGQTQYEQAKYSDAELSLKRSLGVNRNLRPKGSHHAAAVLNGLAVVYTRQASTTSGAIAY